MLKLRNSLLNRARSIRTMIASKFCVTARREWAALLLVIVFAASSYGQSTFGSIRGTAQDSSGAALPDTQITLHSIDVNTDRIVKADAAGNYSIENVLAGKYSVLAKRDGFADTTVSGITLAA